MVKKSILIDAVYINSGGGKVLLEYLIGYLNKLEVEPFYLLDSRLSLDNSIKLKNFYVVKPSEKERKINYQKLKKNNFKSVLCFANIPPPISLESSVYIYFHNELLLYPFKSNSNFLNKFKLFIKKLYILNKNKDNYCWIVQTRRVANKINTYMNVEMKKIKVFPFYKSGNNLKLSKFKEFNTFIYPSNFENHKNHFKLYKAFLKASKKNKIKLYLTIDNKIYEKSFYNKTKNKNIQFINLGLIPNQELIKYISKSKFLIFPSLNETFGLPLIEAVDYGCYLIASDLDYVNEIVQPSLNFNPYSVNSISNAIFDCLNSKNIKSPKIKIENKIGNFVEYILKNV
tara:strand:+ start:515 stop:1543 length:1029 start_codon:yes stop_codon:yes gene_type:complete